MKGQSMSDESIWRLGSGANETRVEQDKSRASATDEKASKLWGSGWRRKHGWPYGPNVWLESREALLAWAEMTGARPSRGQPCGHWLRSGRCAVAECRERFYSPQHPWADHVTTWLMPGGRRLIVAQPYSEADYISETLPQEFRCVVDERGGWYGFGTIWVEVWSS